MNKTLLFLGISIVLIGVYFSLLPHASHESVVGFFAFTGEKIQQDHESHQIVGIGIALLGFLFALAGMITK